MMKASTTEERRTERRTQPYQIWRERRAENEDVSKKDVTDGAEAQYDRSAAQFQINFHENKNIRFLTK